jgi:hypothetical protein
MTPTQASPVSRALFASALIVSASFLLVSAKQSRARVAPACFEYEAPAELPEVQQATWRKL